MMSTYVAPFLTYIVGTATKFCNADGCTRVSHWKFWYLGLDGTIKRFFVGFFYTSISLLLAFLCLNYGRMVAERRTLLHNERLYSWRMFDRSIALYGLRVSRASLFTLFCHHIPCLVGSAMFLYPSGQTMVAICSPLVGIRMEVAFRRCLLFRIYLCFKEQGKGGSSLMNHGRFCLKRLCCGTGDDWFSLGHLLSVSRTVRIITWPPQSDFPAEHLRSWLAAIIMFGNDFYIVFCCYYRHFTSWPDSMQFGAADFSLLFATAW